MSEQPEGLSGKSRKRQTGKAAGGQTAGKVKATIHLSVDADKRLSVHATMMEMDRSELMEMLIVKHLRRYVVSDRGEAAEGAETAA
jgi:hypothetical protein